MRPDIDIWGLMLASVVARRGTCVRRKVGCVLMDARGHILSTGYNGRAAGLPHCLDTGGAHDRACVGARHPSGTGLDLCEAIHAEQNALLQCRDVNQISTCYVTTAPCITCVKLLLNTSCRTIIFTDQYPHKASQVLWVESGREWLQLDLGRRSESTSSQEA